MTEQTDQPLTDAEVQLLEKLKSWTPKMQLTPDETMLLYDLQEKKLIDVYMDTFSNVEDIVVRGHKYD